MAAPTTISVTGTYYKPDGTLAAGSVTFTAKTRRTDASNVIPKGPVVATLAAGVLSQALVSVAGGYYVQEDITGFDRVNYEIAGTSSIDLRTVAAGDTVPDATAYRGVWSSATAYSPGAVVNRWGDNYVCTQANTNQDPATQASYWSLLQGTNRQTIAYAATIAPDFTLGTNVVVGALTGGITINNPAAVPPSGTHVRILFVQDATGSRTVTWSGSNWKNTSGWTMVATASTGQAIEFISDGTNLHRVV